MVPQLASQLETLAAGVTKVSSKVVPISEVDLQVGVVLVDLCWFPFINASLTVGWGGSVKWSFLKFIEV